MHMYFSKNPDSLHISGYHGTDITSAIKIVKEGFRGDTGDVYFAPLNNIGLAESHAILRAHNGSDDTYAVLQGSFPGKKTEFGLRGDHIRIPSFEVGRVTVVGMRIYNAGDSTVIRRIDKDHLAEL